MIRTKVTALLIASALLVTVYPVAVKNLNKDSVVRADQVATPDADQATIDTLCNYYDSASAFLSMHADELPEGVRICLDQTRSAAYNALKTGTGIADAASNLRIQLRIAESTLAGAPVDTNKAPDLIIGTSGYNLSHNMNSRASGMVAAVYATNRHLPYTMMRTAVLNSFVERAYFEIYGKTVDIPTRDYYATALANGTMDAEDVITAMFGTPSFASRNLTNEQYVKVLYQAVLDRDSDPAGLNNWVNALNNGMSRTDVMNSFLAADGFTNLCSIYGL